MEHIYFMIFFSCLNCICVQDIKETNKSLNAEITITTIPNNLDEIIIV